MRSRTKKIKKPSHDGFMSQAEVKKHLKLHGLVWADFATWAHAHIYNITLSDGEEVFYRTKRVEEYSDWKLLGGK